MTLQVWGNPQTGMYYLRHAGKDLEVRRVPSMMKGETKKQYQVIVDGIFAEMGWSTNDAKTKAIKIAEKTRNKEDITPYSERVKERENKRSTSKQTKKEVKSMNNGSHEVSILPTLEIGPVDFFSDADLIDPADEAAKSIAAAAKAMNEISDEDTIDAIVALKAVAAGKHLETRKDPVPNKPASAVEKPAVTSIMNGFHSSPEPQTGEVSFVLTGSFSLDTMPTTDALTTVRAAVELLREHGAVRCRVTVPRTVDL